MPEEPLTHQEIVELLSKLRDDTLEYPAELKEARESSFLKQIVEIEISRRNQGGNGGKQAGAGGGGASGAVLGGGTTLLGFSLKTVILIVAAITVLTATYLFRDQITNFLAENNIIKVEETATPADTSSLTGLTTATPTADTSSTSGSGTVATAAVPSLGTNNPIETPVGTEPGPGQESGQVQGTPTPSAPDSSIRNMFQYLICVLQHGAGYCK
jgi:hypothetical protein